MEMLVLSQHIEEVVTITHMGESIDLKIIDIRGGHVRIGFTGPNTFNVFKPAIDTLNSADSPMSDTDRMETIKRYAVELDLKKEQIVASVQKRGGSGARLADLTSDQLKDLQGALKCRLTAKQLVVEMSDVDISTKKP